MTAGTCQLTSCHLGGVGLVAPGHGNIGPLSATVGTTTVPLSYDGYGYPTVGFPASIALGTGDTMTFRGGSRLDAPWFEVSTRIPGVAVITSPAAAADGSAPTIDTSQDLPVTWVPISIGRITFGLDGGNWEIGGIALSMTCTFDGASGAGVVPRTLLASLKEMTGANPTYAVMGAALEATTVVGGRTIVTQSAQDSPTATRAFNVTLQ